MSDKEEKCKERKVSKKKAIACCFLLVVCSLLLVKPIRRQICDATNICYYTCDEYSGEPIVITLNRPFTCEEVEYLRRQKFFEQLNIFSKPKKHKKHMFHADDLRAREAGKHMSEVCRGLSGADEGVYEVISGTVQMVDIYPSPTADCFFEKGGCMGGQMTYIFVMEGTQGFHVYTKFEKAQKFKQENLYMKSGKQYEFCAKKVPYFEFVPQDRQKEGLTIYKIDHIETIREVK